MEDHWRAGHRDAMTTLTHPEVLTLPTTAQAVAVYDFLTPGRGFSIEPTK